MRKLEEYHAFAFRISYYLRRPWKWFHDLKWFFINKYNRMRSGFGYVDLWNFDSYLSQVVPNAMDELAERSCGWPGPERGYPEYKDWANELHVLARLIRLAAMDIYEDEAFTEEFNKWVSGEILEPIKNLRWYTQYKITDENKECIDSAKDRFEQMRFAQEALEDVIWPQLRRVFHTLWD